MKPSPVRIAASRFEERVPSKKRDCVQDNKEFLANEQKKKRSAMRELKKAERREALRLERQAAAALANVEALRLEGLDRQKKENMTKQHADRDFEDASMTGSDDDKSLPSPAVKLLSDSFAKGKRDANVWNLRNNEEPDDEVKFDSGDDDDEDL